MNRLRTWLDTNFATLILLFTAGGFGFLLAELLLERHWNGTQSNALVAAVAGLILVLLALASSRGLAVVVPLLLLSATGLSGTYQHVDARTEQREGPSGATFQMDTKDATAGEASNITAAAGFPAGSPEGIEERGPEGEPSAGPAPWLAPLALSGLSLLGGVATLAAGHRHEERPFTKNFRAADIA